MIASAILGVAGLQGLAAAHPGGGPGGPPASAPSNQDSQGSNQDSHHGGANGQQPGGQGQLPAADSADTGSLSDHAGAHGPQPSQPSTETTGNGHPGHPRVEVTAAPASIPTIQPPAVQPPAAQPPAAQPPAVQPAAADTQPRIGHAVHGVAQPSSRIAPLEVPGIESSFGSIGTTDARTGGASRPLSGATLRALVPAIDTLDTGSRHGRAAANNARPVDVRTSDPSSPNVIQRIERVVPLGVWIALAAAIALAASAGVAMLIAGRRARHQAARLAAVSAQALTDPLTGVLNRRGFLDALERELARARRYERPVALAYVDVRGLKGVNDSEGHLAGDELLRETANLLQESARADDVVGRIGGDELALLLGEQSSEGATAVATRIRAEVPARREALQLHEPWDLTIGTASYPADGTTVDELLAVADRRLYEQRGIDLR